MGVGRSLLRYLAQVWAKSPSGAGAWHWGQTAPSMRSMSPAAKLSSPGWSAHPMLPGIASLVQPPSAWYVHFKSWAFSHWWA